MYGYRALTLITTSDVSLCNAKMIEIYRLSISIITTSIMRLFQFQFTFASLPFGFILPKDPKYDDILSKLNIVIEQLIQSGLLGRELATIAEKVRNYNLIQKLIK